MTEREIRHGLAVGATGMLAGAAQHLATRVAHLTMVARTEQSLRRFAGRPTSPELRATLVATDYNDTTRFLAAIDRASAQHGAPEVVLAWIHGAEPAIALARHLARPNGVTRFFHVLGSSAASPTAHLAEMRAPFDRLPGIRYHPIILGFAIDGGRSRWLTHNEISAGTIAAMGAPRPVHIVGTVEPWDARP